MIVIYDLMKEFSFFDYQGIRYEASYARRVGKTFAINSYITKNDIYISNTRMSLLAVDNTMKRYTIDNIIQNPYHLYGLDKNIVIYFDEVKYSSIAHRLPPIPYYVSVGTF